MAEVFDGLIHCQAVRTVLLLSWVDLMGVEDRVCNASPTRCCKAATTAVSEASVNKTNIADGTGWAKSVARERLALQSSKAWTMVGVQSTDCDPLILGPANAA